MTQLRPAARELSPTLIEPRGARARPARAVPRPRPADRRLARRPAGAGADARRHQAAARAARAVPAQPAAGLRLPRPLQARDRRLLRARRSRDAGDRRSRPASTRPLHYLRTTNPLNPENLAAYPRRLPSNRSNPYSAPGSYDQLARGLPVFGRYLCEIAGPASFLGPVGPLLPAELRGLIEQFAFAGSATGAVPAPACREQAPLGRLVGQTGRFPNLRPIPAP